MLESRTTVARARVIDLFAGTGALGIEALSRGAAFALFIERSVQAARLIEANIATMGVSDSSRIMRRDATMLAGPGDLGPFDIAFADPPYGKGLAMAAARRLGEHGWLAEGALLVVEEASDTVAEAIDGYERMETRRIGRSAFTFHRYRGGTPADIAITAK